MSSTIIPIEVGDQGNVVYLVVGQRAVFIDSGHDVDGEVDLLLRAWVKVGRPEIVGIILTHRHHDHVGGATKLAEATGGLIVSAPLEKCAIEGTIRGASVNRVVQDGELLDLGGVMLEYVHAPGHTMGSLCVYHHDERVLFTGDTILGGSPTTVIPGQGDMSHYLDTLRKLLTFDLSMIAPGHGPIIVDPRRNIETLIAHRLKRETQIFDLVDGGFGSIDELMLKIYPRLHTSLRRNGKMQIEAHLLKLESDGKVEANEDGRYTPR